MIREAESGAVRRWHRREIAAWLRRGRRGPVAVILGSSVNGLSFARSLGRRGVPVLLLDSERLIGFSTRYAKSLLLPPVAQHPQSWLELLAFLGSKLDTPGVLFPTGDAFCLLVSREQELLRRFFAFCVPNPATLESIVDKRQQYTRARAAGILLPRTHFPESASEARQCALDMPYPCLLKPYRSHLGRGRLGAKVMVVASPAELAAAYARLSAADSPLMIQEIVPGDDSALYGYLAFWDCRGREAAWLTKRKLRQFPAQYGDGSLQVTVAVPEVAELSRRLLREFDFRGFVGIEFKHDARDGTLRLMEINPRTVSGNELAIRAGVDFPWIGYQHLSGSGTAGRSPVAFRVGVTLVNEEWDVQAFLALRKSAAFTLRQWFASLRGAHLAIGAWDDPAPLALGLWRFLRKAPHPF